MGEQRLTIIDPRDSVVATAVGVMEFPRVGADTDWIPDGMVMVVIAGRAGQQVFVLAPDLAAELARALGSPQPGNAMRIDTKGAN